MLPFRAETVFIDPQVYERPNCRARLERMLPHITCDDVREYDEEARQAVSQVSKRRHGKDDFGDGAVVVFSTLDPARRGFHYAWRDEATHHGGACQPGMQLNIVEGCLYRCAYCGFGRKVVFTLDVEAFMEGLPEAFARCPEQRLYKYSNVTDLPPFEPELDAVPPMVERFAREDGRYLMLFTKSDRVDFLEDLDHRGHTIISWSLTCDTASRMVDLGTPDLSERIAAMVRMQRAGYVVRARLSPVVPVCDWRQEYAALFEELFAHAAPDVITLELLGWMTAPDLLALFGRDLLDPAAVAAAEAAADELHQVRWGPFTQATHDEVYRFCVDEVRRRSPATPVSVCHGTAATWQALGDRMAMAPTGYLCNCGPLTAPGGALYDSWHGKRAPTGAEQTPQPGVRS